MGDSGITQKTKNEKVVKLINAEWSMIQSLEMYKIKREELIITNESNRLKREPAKFWVLSYTISDA